MLQKIEAKVQAEGEAETELHEKAMCECKSGKASYTQSISDGEAKVESLAAGLESGVGALSQLKSDLANHKADREAAKDALAEALGMREKEAGAYGGVKAEAEANMAAVGKAVKAIEKNAAAAFLQTDAAQVLRDLAQSDKTVVNDNVRTEVMAFLSNQDEDESEGSGEIVGILKQLGDEMGADLKEATTAEEKAIANYNDLVATKNAEVAELTTMIENKITRVGETGVSIEDMKADASDTADKLVEDKKFLVTLTNECAHKEKEWEAISKERQAELLALADTIKMLNDDDALEIFKKSTAGSASSFMQVAYSSSMVKSRALATIHAAQKAGKSSRHLDLIAMALHGKTEDMSKVIQMIDEMVVVLKTEQSDDDEKKGYCNKALDEAEDKLKGFMRQIQDSETAIKDAKESIVTLEGEMQALVASLFVLDKSVKDATEQRQKENAAYKTLKASNAAAGALVKKAKDRLAQFYGLQVETTSFLQVKRVTKAESSGVIGMLDTLAADLEKETAVATANENDAQADYEKLISDSKTMRTDNSKILEDKTAAKADAEGVLQNHQDALDGQFSKMKGSNDQLKAVHKDCDWLLANYETRSAARADEIDAMGKAKAVLSGADFVQE
jgi:chromosome segregation ATPase